MNPSAKPIVFVDVDDTIADTQNHVLRHINEGREQPYEYDKLDRRFREGSGDGKVYDKAVKELLRPEIMTETAPLAGALAAMERLHDAGYEVHIVSSRREQLHDTTEKWLAKHSFADFVEHIHRRPDSLKGKAFKQQLAQLVKPVALFDDTLDVALELAETVDTIYLIDKPWNNDSDLKLPPNIVRVDDFAAAVDAFLMK